jgi:hypothetical protein
LPGRLLGAHGRPKARLISITLSPGHNILNEQEIKPHKVRYYLERRDPRIMDARACDAARRQQGAQLKPILIRLCQQHQGWRL